jgi:hypothetical protein
MNILARNIVYSEHGIDECFEYKNSGVRVPDGLAVGYTCRTPIDEKNYKETLFLFDDVEYSKYDHPYWDNLELENDIDRIVM